MSKIDYADFQKFLQHVKDNSRRRLPVYPTAPLHSEGTEYSMESNIQIIIGAKVRTPISDIKKLVHPIKIAIVDRNVNALESIVGSVATFLEKINDHSSSIYGSFGELDDFRDKIIDESDDESDESDPESWSDPDDESDPDEPDLNKKLGVITDSPKQVILDMIIFSSWLSVKAPEAKVILTDEHDADDGSHDIGECWVGIKLGGETTPAQFAEAYNKAQIIIKAIKDLPLGHPIVFGNIGLYYTSNMTHVTTYGE
jgi:hypothetical protein